jgi:beta-lactamase class A
MLSVLYLRERVRRAFAPRSMRLAAITVGGALLAGGGYAAGAILHGAPLNNGIDGFVELRLGAANGDLTNPVLECKEGVPIAVEKQDFRRDLEAFVGRLERSDRISRIGVSFRDLNNGPSFGIDRDVPFLPASLLKVPVMITFLKKAETDKGILDLRLRFIEPVMNVPQLFPPEIELERGKTYTVKELIERMIKYSDNEALFLLAPHIPEDEERRLYSLLGIDIDTVRSASGAMSVREYNSFFRILYNSSFLSRENSEYALSLLRDADFNGGLRRGVPDNIPVARKFGERELGSGKQHFHDCGIVYYPQHPYLLCIMTQGNDIASQMEAITSISNFVYVKIAEQYPR